MRRANFKLPNQQKLVTETSTYKSYISDATQGINYSGASAELLTHLKKSSFAIGQDGIKNNTISEAKQQFGRPAVDNETNQINKANEKDLINNLKGHHFDFGRKGMSMNTMSPTSGHP